MDKVRFGIIGVGNMGYAHAKCFDGGGVENGVLTAVADIAPAKLERIKKEIKQPVALFDDAEKMLDSKLIDAVIVAVPHYFHPPLVISALKKGIHAISEKPAGVYTKQVKEMNDAARKSDKLFAVMFNQRTNCVYRKMRELILNGEIGDIKRINWIITNWYRTQSYYDSGEWRATWSGEGGGVLFNQCPHQLDLLQWVTGMMPCKIRSFCHFGKWHNIEVEDDVTAYLEYENGATGCFITSTADWPGTNRFEVLGTMGRLICENDKLNFIKLKQNEREFNFTCEHGFAVPDSYEVEVVTDGKNTQHAGILNNFANAVLGIEPLFVDGTEGINGVELMDAMLLSAWKNQSVSLPIDDDEYLNYLKEKIAGSKKKAFKDVTFDISGTYSGGK